MGMMDDLVDKLGVKAVKGWLEKQGHSVSDLIPNGNSNADQTVSEPQMQMEQTPLPAIAPKPQTQAATMSPSQIPQEPAKNPVDYESMDEKANSKDDEEQELEEGTKEAPPTTPALVQTPSQTTPPSNAINFGSSLGTQSNLQNVLQQAKQATLMNQLGKSAELTASGIGAATGGGIIRPTERTGSQLFDQNIALAQQGVRDFQALTEQEKKDPNSDYAKGLRDFMKKQFGMNIQGGTPEQIMSVAPMALKAYDTKLAADARLKVAEQRANLAETKAASGEKQHTSDKQQQALSQTIGVLESARGNPEVSQALRDRYAASKALPLINKYDPNNLSPQQVSLVASELSKIATGGVPTHAEMQALTPNTLASKFASIAQMVINKPTPANAGAFLKQYKDYLTDLQQNAQNVVRDKIGRVIETNKNRLGEENYNSLKEQYLKSQEPTQTSEKQTSEHAPGDLVNYKGKQYKVGADGDTLEPM